MNLKNVNKSLNDKGVCIIKEEGFRSIASKAQEEYIASMKANTLIPQKQQFHYTDLFKKPHRKLAIGSTNGLGHPIGQFLQTTYFSKDDVQYPNLGAMFSYLIKLRNNILGVDEDFGNDPERDRFWNACRIHHYPVGGGFMTEHVDSYFPDLLAKSGHPFLQVICCLSQRGEGFKTGGGYVINREGEKVSFEDNSSKGNIVCFDGSILHGVEDVDNDEIVDFNSSLGRIASFVGLYKKPD